MNEEQKLKERYMRDAVPMRLGNLASSVKRLGFFVSKKKYDTTVQQLFQECRLFSAWTAPDASFEIKTALEGLLLDLENWQNYFRNPNNNELWRDEIDAACGKWSNHLLELSGLLKTGSYAHRAGQT